MWLRADLARVLLIVGLLLMAVAISGERVSRMMVEAEPVMQDINDYAVSVMNEGNC